MASITTAQGTFDARDAGGISLALIREDLIYNIGMQSVDVPRLLPPRAVLRFHVAGRAAAVLPARGFVRVDLADGTGHAFFGERRGEEIVEVEREWSDLAAPEPPDWRPVATIAEDYHW